MPTHKENVTLALFKSPKTPTFEAVSLPRAEFIQRMLEHKRVVRKDTVPLFSPTEYLPGKTTRSKYGVAAVTLFVFDIERKVAGSFPLAEAMALTERIKARGWTYVLSSSHSHTDEDCRLRLVLFPDGPILPTEFREARRRLRAALDLDGLADPAAEDLPRIFYWPSCPPDAEPVTDYFEGRDVCMEDLLEGYIAAPFEPYNKQAPEGWEYIRPESPVLTDLSPLHAVLDSYKGGGSDDAEDKARKVNAIRAVRKGVAYATNNFNSAMWSTVSILARILPSGTSPEEIVAVLTPSLTTMYGAGRGPISLEHALGKASEMAERAVEKRAHDDAADEAIQRLFREAPARLDAALTRAAEAGVESRTREELAEAEEEIKECDIIFHVPDERFYYRAGDGSFDLANPVGKDGIMAHMTFLGLNEPTIKNRMKSRDFSIAHGIDFAPGKTSIFKENNRTIINSWRPSEIIPRKGEYPSIHRVLDSLLFNEVDGIQQVDQKGKRRLLNWLAWCVQNPNGVPGVAVLFNGVQGAGKNVLAHVMFRIIGEHNTDKITSEQIENRFTSTWTEKCFLLGDEMQAADYNNRDVMAKLKDLITASTVSSEGKGKNRKVVRNRAKFMFASNEAMPLKLDPTDRRYTVFTRNEPVDAETWHPFLQSLFTSGQRSTPAFDAEIAALAWDLERMDAVRNGHPEIGGASVVYPNASRAALLNASETSNVAFCKYVDANGIDSLLHAAVKRSLGWDVAAGEWHKHVAACFPGLEDWDFGDRGVHMDLVHFAYKEFCTRYSIPHPRQKNQLGVLINSHRPAWPSRHLVGPVTKRQQHVYVVKRSAVTVQGTDTRVNVPAAPEAKA